MIDYTVKSVENFLLSFFSTSYREKAQILIEDVIALYEGRWPEFEACDVPYHNLGHALKTAEAAMILLKGWEKARKKEVSPDTRWLALVSALFHDSGYLKDRGDREGTGAKYTFVHVERSARIARLYLQRQECPPDHLRIVEDMIALTDFLKEVSYPPTLKGDLKFAASAVATADLLTQVSSFNYPEKIRDLFEEFQEAYAREGEENLKKQGIRLYRSYDEMLKESVSFFREYVFPRFEALGHMERYAEYFFPGRRNYFLEAMFFNLALLENYASGGQESDKEVNDIRLLEILPVIPTSPGFMAESMEACLPEVMMRVLEKDDLVFFLRIALLCILLERSEALDTLLEILCEYMNCEAATVFKAEQSFLRPVACAGPVAREFKKMLIPLEESLCGWVFLQKRPAIVNSVYQSGRFWSGSDQSLQFVTRNLMAVPVKIEDGTSPKGVVELVNKHSSFSKHDLYKAILWCRIVHNLLKNVL